MSNSIKSQAISGVKWSLISKVYSTIVSVLQVAILTRFLAKEDFGLMGIAVLVNSFCNIFMDMGLSAAVMHNQNLTKQQFSSYYWLNLVTGFLLTLLIGACSPLIAAYYHRDELVGIISLTSVSIFLLSLISLQRTIQQKQMNFKFMSIVDIMAYTVSFGINILLAVSGFGIFSLVWAQLVSGFVVAIAYLYISVFKGRSIAFHFDVKEVREALKIGIYQVGTSSLDFMSREMDSFIISSHMPMELFGIYTLCKNLTMRIYNVVNPIVTNVMTPILAKIQNDKNNLSDAYLRVADYLGYINFPIYGMVFVASYSIMSILYGESYRPYAFVMAGLAIYYAFQSCGNPMGALLIATGRTDRGFYWTIFRLLFTFVYLNIASLFELKIFVLFIVLIPLISAYPSWHIMLRVISNISFGESVMLSLKPMMTCLPILPLYLLNKQISSPFVSMFIVCILFGVGYYVINRLYRPKLQNYILNTLLQELHIDKYLIWK